MNYAARKNFTSNRSAVVLAIVGGVMVCFVDEVAPGTQEGIRKLRKWSRTAVAAKWVYEPLRESPRLQQCTWR